MRMRARSSVGTCALSKLLSRHKLLVSDQFLTSQYICLGVGLLLFCVSIGLMSSLVVSGFGYFLQFFLFFFFKKQKKNLEVILFFFFISPMRLQCRRLAFFFEGLSSVSLCDDLNLK